VKAEVPRPLPTSGRWTSLRPVSPADYGFLFDLFTAPAVLHSWNLRGRVPSFEEFPTVLWDRVLTQFMIIQRATGEPIGLASLYSPDFKNRFVKFALIVSPTERGVGWALEGAALAIEYAFVNWDFRKVFIEVLEFNVESLGLAGLPDTCVEEGRYREFEYYEGRYWDLVVYGVTRDAWANRELMPDVGRGR
jgi:RimJ/RimL family protein N-acetyltransferase